MTMKRYGRNEDTCSTSASSTKSYDNSCDWTGIRQSEPDHFRSGRCSRSYRSNAVHHKGEKIEQASEIPEM